MVVIRKRESLHSAVSVHIILLLFSVCPVRFRLTRKKTPENFLTIQGVSTHVRTTRCWPKPM